MEGLTQAMLVARGGGGGGSDIKYHPAPSTGHEIGVMFGGLASMVIGAGLFYAWWQLNLKKEVAKEEDRVRDLKTRGLFDNRD